MPDIFKPDQKYFSNLAETIVRMSGVPRDQVDRVDINCGGSGLGTVILKDGTQIKV